MASAGAAVAPRSVKSYVTIAAVGYFEVHPLTTAGRVFNMFLIFFGASIMVYSMSAITQTVLETQFSDLLGRRRTKKMIDSLKDHFLVCGFGRVGRAAALELQRTSVPFLVMWMLVWIDMGPLLAQMAMSPLPLKN